MQRNFVFDLYLGRIGATHDSLIIIKAMLRKRNIPIFSNGREYSMFESGLGKTLYYEFGKPGQPCVMLLHGYLCSGVMYHELAEFLESNGFYVVAFDFFGTGGSIKKCKAKYNISLFTQQLRDLMAHLKLNKVSLVGYSMGGAVAGLFASESPDLVEKLVLLSPGGIKVDFGAPLIIMIMKTPILGPIYIYLLYHLLILGSVKVNFVQPDLPALFGAIQLLYLHIYSSWAVNPTFSSAACGTMRHMEFNGLEHVFESISVPTLVFLAKQDLALPFEPNHSFWSKQTKFAKVDIIDGAGHWALYEKKPRVFNSILSHLK